MTVTLVDKAERSRTPADLAVPVREALAVIPGIEVSVSVASSMGGNEAPVQISISGNALDVLQPRADELVRRLIGRGTETPEEQQRRLETAKVELAAEDEFDRTVMNVTVQDAAREVVELMNLSARG